MRISYFSFSNLKRYLSCTKEGKWPDFKPLKKIRVKKYRIERDKLRDRDKEVFSKSKKNWKEFCQNLRRSFKPYLNPNVYSGSSTLR